MLLNGWLASDGAGGVKPRNWGDDINLPLLEAVTKRRWKLLPQDRLCAPEEDLLFIGSTMSLVRPTTVVWGAGVKRADFKLPAKPARICSVRGPRTRQCLLDQGVDCPEVYGDPALLLPYVYRPSLKKRFRVTVIPHYRDYDLPHVAAFRAAHPEVNFIDMRHYGDWRSVVDRIAASELVVSSSLHGLIAADAYGVPNVWAEFSDAMRGEILKYHDYAEGVGRDLNAPLDFRTSLDLAAAERLARAWRPVHFDCAKFLTASPLAHPLKVLFVVKPGVGTITRHTFTETLGAALVKAGCRVDYGRDRFWRTKPGTYDIVHLQWPEILIGGKAEAATEATLARIRGRLAELKRAGSKIVYTRHNRLPHRIAGEGVEKLTEICETRVNAIVHMGETSRRECIAKHPEATTVVQAVIPHHLKDEIDFSLSREAARSRLGIAADERVMLAFGAFRHEEEVALLRQAVAGLDVPRFRLLAPQCPGEGFVGVVPDEELPVYFAAADVVFLPRVKVLNSGILPLAFDAARVCVGPSDGNAGEILRETGNPVFDSTDRASVQAAIHCGFELSAKGKGAENRAFARARWTPQMIARKTVALYRELVGVSILRHRALKVAFADIGNMGDQLNRLIFDRLFGYAVETASPEEAELFGIGSHLSLLAKVDPARQPPVVVWGTGFISRLSTTARLPATGVEYRAVRGELTRRVLERKLGRPLEIPTGDPGLLANLLFTEPVPKSHRLGIIPHFREQDDPRFAELAKLSDDSVLIDLTGDPMAVIREIASCERVISSSLHGLIVADSFGIPNLHVKVSDRVNGDGFKFADYYSAFGLEHHPFDLNERSLDSLDLIADRSAVSPEAVQQKRCQLRTGI